MIHGDGRDAQIEWNVSHGNASHEQRPCGIPASLPGHGLLCGLALAAFGIGRRAPPRRSAEWALDNGRFRRHGRRFRRAGPVRPRHAPDRRWCRAAAQRRARRNGNPAGGAAAATHHRCRHALAPHRRLRDQHVGRSAIRPMAAGVRAVAGGGGGNGGGGVPPRGERRFVPDEVITAFSSNATPQAIEQIARRHNLTQLEDAKLRRCSATRSIAGGSTAAVRWRPRRRDRGRTHRRKRAAQLYFLTAGGRCEEDDRNRRRATPRNTCWANCKSSKPITLPPAKTSPSP